MPRNPKKVLIYENKFRGFRIDVHMAILEYARTHGNWKIIEMPHPLGTFESEAREIVAHARELHPDGVIGSFGNSARARAWSTFPAAAVSLYGGRPMLGLPQVGPDDQAIGRMAAEYLANCGFRHFAYYGFGSRSVSSGRWFGFRQTLEARGLTAQRYAAPKTADPEPDTKRLYAWLKQLPKPVGLLAAYDTYAGRVCDACWELGISVPEEIAVLSVGDDRLRCLSHHVSISSIRLPGKAIGHALADLLDKRMNKRKIKETAVYFPPEGVTVRQSTDTLAISDPDVVAAIRFIRENACRRITLEDILAQTSICQSLLNRKFHELVGRTPFQEIRRVRMEKAKLLLRDTSKTTEDIARLCAYSNAFQFSREFLKETDMRPTAYRKQFQRR